MQYIAHASFLLQTHGGLSAVTDFTGFVGNVDFLPDIVTMNHAHATHFTAFPDPAIPHVLPGWGKFGEGIDHHLDLGEMLIRNISTDIRSGAGIEQRGNSIFVFEVAGLCIGHLGHLHHEPSPEQYAAIGRLDVVMAAVDGGSTIPIEPMVRILKRLKSRIVIPMHAWSVHSLAAFLEGMSSEFEIVFEPAEELVISARTLPAQPTVRMMLPQGYDPSLNQE